MNNAKLWPYLILHCVMCAICLPSSISWNGVCTLLPAMGSLAPIVSVCTQTNSDVTEAVWLQYTIYFNILGIRDVSGVLHEIQIWNLSSSVLDPYIFRVWHHKMHFKMKTTMCSSGVVMSYSVLNNYRRAAFPFEALFSYIFYEFQNDMSHCQMLGKFEYGLPAKFWRLVGCTEMLSW